MSLISKIENLQKRPESVRRRVLFIVIAMVMFFVVSAWVFTLKFSLNREENKNNQAAIAPFKIIMNMAKESFDIPVSGIKNTFDRLKEEL